MRLISISAAFLAVCTSLAAPIETKSSSLDVTLSQVDNTHIKAIITNTGDEDITFMHLGSFGDGSPVKKVSVYRNGMYLPPSAVTGTDALQELNWTSSESKVTTDVVISLLSLSLSWLQVLLLRMSLILLRPVIFRTAAW